MRTDAVSYISVYQGDILVERIAVDKDKVPIHCAAQDRTWDMIPGTSIKVQSYEEIKAETQ